MTAQDRAEESAAFGGESCCLPCKKNRHNPNKNFIMGDYQQSACHLNP
jgi:hypothetical protein